MKWAATALGDSWAEGNAKPIPVPWPTMAAAMSPKGGNSMVLIAAPGVGKTLFTLNWVAQAGLKAVYISADTSMLDMTEQLAALATGHTRQEVSERLTKYPSWRELYASSIRKAFPNIMLDGTSSPRMSQIRRMVEAATEVWGETPDIIVMDTASDVNIGDKGNNADWEQMWLDARKMSRDFNSLFLFAHHVRQGMARSGKVAPELNDGLWGCDKFPEIVMGIHSSNPNQLTCTLRKNRSGKKDVSIALDVDFARARVMEQQRNDITRSG